MSMIWDRLPKDLHEIYVNDTIDLRNNLTYNIERWDLPVLLVTDIQYPDNTVEFLITAQTSGTWYGNCDVEQGKQYKLHKDHGMSPA